jgi:metal-responsive CopG/Arc/MetJ family transcriptional regulator
VTIRVNISISKEILEKVDAAAKDAKTSRSGLLSQAALCYLQEKEEENALYRRQKASDIIDRIRDTYGTWDGAAEIIISRDQH